MECTFCWTLAIVVAVIACNPMNMAAGKEDNVTLTIEGRVSLVGSYCPGTVRLFCEGVDLPYFGWRYNADIDIIDTVFPGHPDSQSLPITAENAAFLSVSVTLNDKNERVANFSSVLTVDVVQLSKQNISSISCGDLIANEATQQVGITLVHYSIPTITALYQFGILNKIKIQLPPACLQSNVTLVYNVNITGYNDLKEISCMDTSTCFAMYTEFMGIDDHSLTIVTRNRTHILEMFEYSIAYRREKYNLTWTVAVNSTVCEQYEYTVNCAATQNSCGLRYTTTDYGSSSTDEYSILQTHISSKPGSVHSIEFFAMVSDHLLIEEIIQQDEHSSIDSKGIIILLLTSIFVFMSSAHLLLLIIGVIWRAKNLIFKKKSHIFSAVVLFLLTFLCIILLFTFGIFTENIMCDPNGKTQQNTILDIMMVIASLGIVTVIVIWTLTIKFYYKQIDSRHKTNKAGCDIEKQCHKSEEPTSDNNEVGPYPEGYDMLNFSPQENQCPYSHLSMQEAVQSEESNIYY